MLRSQFKIEWIVEQVVSILCFKGLLLIFGILRVLSIAEMLLCKKELTQFPICFLWL